MTSVVPLTPGMDNKSIFINSLFNKDVRDPATNNLYEEIKAGNLIYSYADSRSRGFILNGWLAAWQKVQEDHYDQQALDRCPEKDKELIDFFANFIKVNQLYLCVPNLVFDHMENETNKAVYINKGYDRLSFISGSNWLYGSFDNDGNLSSNIDESTVARFLEYLFYGAHMVVVSSSKDRNHGNDVENFYQSFLQPSALQKRKDPWNSHYGKSGGVSGIYYLDIEGESMPDEDGKEPLIIAFLSGLTSSPFSSPNSFIQLEGWQCQIDTDPLGGERHHVDYESNENTFWNFSTFGGCAFSEKRCSPIFLANDKFDLTLHNDTHMPYYWGGNSGNVDDEWMHPQYNIIG